MLELRGGIQFRRCESKQDGLLGIEGEPSLPALRSVRLTCAPILRPMRTSRINANTRQCERVCDVCGAVIDLDTEEIR